MGLECLEVSLCLYEYAGVKKKKKKRVHSSLIYRRILIIYTPN
jgi:hypothetical protein